MVGWENRVVRYLGGKFIKEEMRKLSERKEKYS